MGGDAVILYTHLVFIIEIFFIPLFLVRLAVKAGINDSKIFFRLLLVIGSFAAVITVASFIVPSIGSFVRYELMYTTSDSLLYTDNYRGFGLAIGLSFSYGIIQGVIIAVGTFHIKDNKWFILLYPLVLVSILLNARTGLIVALIGILIYLLMNDKIKSLFSVTIVILFAFMVIDYGLSTLSVSRETLTWIEEFFNQLISVRREKSLYATYTLDSLFGRMWVWPVGLDEWIFGKGIIIVARNNAVNSDIGYIQQLNYGGLGYVFILAIFLINVIKRMIKNNIDITFVLFFIGVFIIANFKGNYLINNGAFRFMMYIYYFIIYNRRWQVNRSADSTSNSLSV